MVKEAICGFMSSQNEQPVEELNITWDSFNTKRGLLFKTGRMLIFITQMSCMSAQPGSELLFGPTSRRSMLYRHIYNLNTLSVLT